MWRCRVVLTCPAPYRPVRSYGGDGRPVTESAVDRALTTQAILDQEAALLGWADRRTLTFGDRHPDAPTRARPGR